MFAVVRQTFAGVVSLLNDYLLSKGKAPLGFLNPLIYSKATSGFNDITSGSNPGCGTNGFTAGAGWDPVSVPSTEDPCSCAKSRADHRCLVPLSVGHRLGHARLRQATGSDRVSCSRSWRV